ncbi:hypothetical protein [Nitrosomonas sp. Is37]|uniref:hypothetical protein n=1 Tax=Nitrosomonas sp. Is37 TaxID=3080535 RepID=UPI00294B07BB|nr:hypothetical protein [Nitrosomonas sp. Is37]MDV6342964.1 hypothetical protein [Nitrosomonas sp. Is37]
MNDDGLNHDLNDDKGGLRDDTSDDNPNGSNNHKAFKFVIENNKVVQVFEFKDGQLEPKNIDNDDIFEVQGNQVIFTEIKPFGREVTTFVDDNGDGIFVRIAEQQIVDPGAQAPFKIHDQLRFDPTDDDDFIAVTGGEHVRGGGGADDFVFREPDHLEVEDFHHDQGDRLVFDTGLGLQSKEQLMSFVTDLHFQGDNLIVNFGSNVSITLTGVHEGQISLDDVVVLS